MFSNIPNSSDIKSYNDFLSKEKESILNLFENNGSISVKLKIEVENIYKDCIDTPRGNEVLIDIYRNNGLLWSKNSFFEKLKKFKKEDKKFLAVTVLGLFLKKVTINNYVSYDIIPEVYELAQLEIIKYNKELEKEKFKDTPYRVLTIDGGGILGYYQASLLEVLSSNRDVGSLFNLICGTSTGSILAAGLAKNDLSLEKIKGIYRDKAEEIFPYPQPPSNKTQVGWRLCHLYKPSSCQTNLYNVLKNIFNEQTLEELSREKDIKLFIPSVSADEHTAIIFSSEGDYKSYKVEDVCLASSAAPIYFPFAEIPHGNKINKYIDGGLWANNPILIGLVEALKYADKNQDIEIYILSAPPRLKDNNKFIEEKNQGILHWGVGIKIVDIALSSQSSGYIELAENFVKYFNDHSERKIFLNTFNHAHQRPKEIESLRLDNSDDKHFEYMDDLVIRAKGIQPKKIVDLLKNETLYLISSKRNRDRLDDAVEQIEKLDFKTKELGI